MPITVDDSIRYETELFRAKRTFFETPQENGGHFFQIGIGFEIKYEVDYILFKVDCSAELKTLTFQSICLIQTFSLFRIYVIAENLPKPLLLLLATHAMAHNQAITVDALRTNYGINSMPPIYSIGQMQTELEAFYLQHGM